MKMNTFPKDTLAGGVSLGPAGSNMVGDHNPSKLVSTKAIRTELVLDILNGCQFNCGGCFIPRRNTCTPDDLQLVLQLANTLTDMGVVCEDLFLGPTDIFTATNFDSIMSDPAMAQLTSRFALGVSSTLMGDHNAIINRWHVIQRHLDAAPARDFDLHVAFDLAKYLANDSEYVSTLKRNLKLFRQDTVYFVINYVGGMFNETNMHAIAQRIYDEFNVPTRLLPSFFRLTGRDRVEPKAAAFEQMMRVQMATNNTLPEHLHFNMFDKYFGGDGFINLSFKDSELYVTPFLYEAIPQTHPMFKIQKPYTADNIATKVTDIVTEQYKYATHTEKCADCELLPSCVGRKILTYMESRELIYCVVPKEHIWENVS